jgi:hypothetical protein
MHPSSWRMNPSDESKGGGGAELSYFMTETLSVLDSRPLEDESTN